MAKSAQRVADRYLSAGLSGRQVVYPDLNSKKAQPPGLLGVEPALAKIMKWRPLGEVNIPSSSGIRETPVSDLAGVPASILDEKNLDRIHDAYKKGIQLPPIDIQVHKDKIHLIDGNHRLTYVRRNKKIRTILVKWHIRA